MKRTALALALGALSATAAMAGSGDAWYGTNRAVIVGPTVTYVEPAPTPSEGVIVYYDEPARTAPVIVERSYVTQPYGVVVVESPSYEDNSLFRIEPRKYGTVDNGGLFPRRGPNDFGS